MFCDEFDVDDDVDDDDDDDDDVDAIHPSSTPTTKALRLSMSRPPPTNTKSRWLTKTVALTPLDVKYDERFMPVHRSRRTGREKITTTYQINIFFNSTNSLSLRRRSESFVPSSANMSGRFIKQAAEPIKVRSVCPVLCGLKPVGL